MTTNAWVDWSALPNDISRKIYKQAISGEGSYDHTLNIVDPYYRNRDGWFKNFDQLQNLKFEVPVDFRDEMIFHPNADRTTPMERLRYVGLAAGAAVTVGLGISSWQATKKEERAKASVINDTDGAKAMSIDRVIDQKQYGPETLDGN
tara:strand:- start:62 stop:505 length:444 start_codon:yes stop_codon:yes gene_type:complete